MIQGEFSLKRLNLLLVFQVNCPGCFFYALPLFNQLYQDKDLKQCSFLALSTAFEDFDKNTRHNTELMVTDAKLIGETKKEFSKLGYDSLPYKVEFPIAMDAEVLDTAERQNLVTAICNLNPNYQTWADWEQEMMNQKVVNYLDQLEKISYTFSINQLKGTPTLLLFDNQYRIVAEWFGHHTYQEIKEGISAFL